MRQTTFIKMPHINNKGKQNNIMDASARCSASCGELIKGWIGDGEKIISCPVDWYSEVSVHYTDVKAYERPNMRKALQATLDYLQVDDELGDKLQITLRSNIPVAKGMASSTADIAATITATARWLGASLSQQELVNLCLKLEPTDSTIFSTLTLFDHIKGDFQQALNNPPKLDILILEPEQTLTTAEYHCRDHRPLLRASAALLETAWQKYNSVVKTTVQPLSVRLPP